MSIPGFSSVPQSKLTPLQGFNDHTFECLQWLDKQPTSSVLYIAFGSVIEISSEETVELAYALEITNVKFLWVLKASSSTPLSKFLPPGFEARTKKRGFTTSWAPQTQILMHASIAGFMTHCGWNSILEGLCSGVSFIAWPLANDEQQNARCDLCHPAFFDKFCLSSSLSLRTSESGLLNHLEFGSHHDSGNDLSLGI